MTEEESIEQDEKDDAFIEEIVAVCLKHGRFLGHEDTYGGFTIETTEDGDADWLLAAGRRGSKETTRTGVVQSIEIVSPYTQYLKINDKMSVQANRTHKINVGDTITYDRFNRNYGVYKK